MDYGSLRGIFVAANQTVRDVLLVSVLAGALIAPGSIALGQLPAGDKASARPAHSAEDEPSAKGTQFAGKDRQELSKRMGESLNKVMTGCFINGAAGQAKSEASKLYKQSLEEAASGKIDQAKLTMGKCIKLLQTPEEKALVKKPEMAAYRLSRAYLGRGNFSIKTKDFNGAVQDLTCAINASPNYALPYVLRGVAYSGLKDKANSDRDMRKAMGLKAFPDFLMTELARDKSYQSAQSDIRQKVH